MKHAPNHQPMLRRGSRLIIQLGRYEKARAHNEISHYTVTLELDQANYQSSMGWEDSRKHKKTDQLTEGN